MKNKLLFWFLVAIVHSFGIANDSFFVVSASGEAQELIRKATNSVAQKQWQKAIEHYKKIINNYPNSLIKIDEKNYRNALKTAQKGILDLPPEGKKIYQKLNLPKISAEKQPKPPQANEDITKENNWPIFGGNATANLTESVPAISLNLPYSRTLQFPIHRPKRDKYFVNEPPQRMRKVIPYYPVVYDDVIYINNGKDIWAYELFSQKLKWHYKGLISQVKSVPNSQEIHSLMVDQSGIYANIEGTNENQREEVWSVYRIKATLPTRRLIKLSHNGEMLWCIGHSEKNINSFVYKACFTGPPVLYGSYLYIGATEYTGFFHNYVVCIDPKTGKIIWKTLIGSAQQGSTIFNWPARGPAATRVTVSENKIYYLTNMGAIACVEADSGKISWLYSYDRIPLKKAKRALSSTIYRKEGWNNSPIIFQNGFIYLAPIDSHYLYCFHGQSGKLIWKTLRKNSNYLLAVTNNKVFVGNIHLNIIDSQTGRTLKTINTPRRVSGRGGVINNLLYFPTQNNILVYLDINQLRIVKNIYQRNLGHILKLGLVTLNTYRGNIDVFYDKQITRKLRRRIMKKPEQFSSYLRLANFYQQHNRHKNAEGIYKKLLEQLQSIKSTNKKIYINQVNAKLTNLYLMQIAIYEKSQLAKAQEICQKALPFVDEKTKVKLLYKLYSYTQDDNYLKKLIQNHSDEIYQEAKVGLSARISLIQIYSKKLQTEAAVGLCREILLHFPNDLYGGETGQELAMRNIKSLIARFGRKVYQKYDLEAKQLYEKQKNASENLERIIQQYPNSSLAPEISIKLAQILIAKKQFSKGAALLKNFITKSSEKDKLLQAYLLLIECYEQLGAYNAACALLEQFKENFGKETIDTPAGLLKVSKYVYNKLQQKIYQYLIIDFPRLDLWKGKSALVEFSQGRKRMRLLEIKKVPREYQNLVFLATDKEFHALNAVNGKIIWKQNISFITQIIFRSHFLIVRTPYKILCLNPQTGTIYWQYQVNSHIVSFAANSKALGVSSDYVLMVLDLKTGKLIWKQNWKQKLAAAMTIHLSEKKAFLHTSSNPNTYLVTYLIIDVDSGKTLSKSTEKGIIPGFVVDGEKLFIIKHKWLECYDMDLLQRKWLYSIEKSFFKQQVHDKNAVFMSRKNLLVLDSATGKLRWSYRSPEESDIIKFSQDREAVYVLTKNEEKKVQLWALSSYDGSVKWKSVILEKSMIATIKMSQKYICLLLTTRQRHFISKFALFDKFTGKLVKFHTFEEANIIQGYIAGKNLWVTTGNKVWAFGKKERE